MAFTGALVWYTGSAHWTAVAVKAINTPYVVGALVRESAPIESAERVFVCVVAGTSSATPPTMATGRGATTVDGTVTWQECSGVAAFNGDLTNTPTWNTVKGTVISLGHTIKSNDGLTTLLCVVTGTAGSGAEPSWVQTDGSNTTDNTVTWRTMKHTGAKFGAWAAPIRSISLLVTRIATGEGLTGFVANTHNYTNATNNMAFGTLGAQWLCVDPSVSPPTALSTGAVEVYSGTGATSAFNFSQACLMHGITLRISGTTANVVSMLFSTNVTCRNCRFELTGTGVGTVIRIAGSTSVRWDNCTVKFGAAGQGIGLNSTTGAQDFTWRGGGVDVAGTIPTSLFLKVGTVQQEFEVRGCDLRGLGSNSLVDGTIIADGLFEDCLWDAATKVVSANVTDEATRIRVIRSPSTGVDRGHMAVYGARGQVTSDETVVRTGGAIVNGIGVSWNVTTFNTALLGPAYPFPVPPMQISNTVVAGTTLTIYGILNAAALPSLTDLYLGITYLGSDASCLASNDIQDFGFLATPGSVTADTSAWDSAASARQNTHAYLQGAQIALASNPGRVFFCTTAGTSSGSEPVGYSGAVDGGSVTDGTAVFRAGVRFALARTVSPLLTGALTVRAYAALANTTWWIDPAIAQT